MGTGPSIANCFEHRNKISGSLEVEEFSNIYSTRCNVTQVNLSGNCSTCFGWYHHPSSGAQTTVSTASGICHTVTAACRYIGVMLTTHFPSSPEAKNEWGYTTTASMCLFYLHRGLPKGPIPSGFPTQTLHTSTYLLPKHVECRSQFIFPDMMALTISGKEYSDKTFQNVVVACCLLLNCWGVPRTLVNWEMVGTGMAHWVHWFCTQAYFSSLLLCLN
jgi:hypothetical protein